MKYNDFLKEFKSPDCSYRSLPFISLNGLLDSDELAAQMKNMISHGMGGGFLHSREGLETTYMSEEWMSALESAIKAAGEKGGSAWLYDEDRFPSGGAGGKVQSAEREKFTANAVTMAVDENDKSGNILLRAAFYSDETGTVHFRKLEEGEKAGSGEHEAVFRHEISGPCMWFNNEGPSDNLNADAVREFLNVTHEKYKKRFGEYFGKEVPGIFTDEPNINDFRCSYTPGRPYLPWTNGFEEYFTVKRGYSITEKLPLLFMEGEESFKVRHDYWHTVSERFIESWSEQIGNWCLKNGLCYTGHYMGEHSLGTSVRMSGAVMPHYLYQGMPGIDMLTGDAREYLTAKQVSGAANQLGRRSICEMYGCSGWDYTFEGQRRTSDWLYVMGIDTRCLHHALYTVKGTAKRDYPPSFNYNSVWWEHNNVTEDYFARLSAALSGGRALRKVLILHPQSTAWGYTGAGSCKDYVWTIDDTKSDALQHRLEMLMKRMMAEHVDFDFGDEITLEKIGKAVPEGISAGQMTYPVVIVPWLETVLPATKKLLEDFSVKGGKVIALGGLPSRVDGALTSEGWLGGAFSCESIQDCIDLLNTLLPDRIHITDESGREAEVFALLKEYEDYRTLFIVNENGPKKLNVTLPDSFAGNIVKCDALTGTLYCISPYGSSFGFELDEHDSALFYIGKEIQAEVRTQEAFYRDPYRMRRLGFPQKVTRTHPNVLLLDKASWRLNGGPVHKDEYIFDVQAHVRTELGMSAARTTPQRYMWINQKHKNDGALLEIFFSFDVKDVPEGPVRLAAEDIDIFDVTLNGERCDSARDGYYIDRCIGTKVLPELRKGRNELALSCRYKNRTQIEDMFITGDFGVSPGRIIVAEPEKVYPGDWCIQGYYHYAGALKYSYGYTYSGCCRRRIYIGDYKGVTACVYVNGRKACDIPWKAADGADITDFLNIGSNEICIEIMGSQRNVMGLFHKTGCQNEWVDWTFFKRSDARLADDYDVVPYGLMNVPCVLEEQ